MAVKDLLVIKAESGYTLALDDDYSYEFIDPSRCATVGGTYTLTRNADGDFSLNKTAAADTTYVYASLRPFYKTGAGRGAQVKSVDVIYSIATLALTSHTPLIKSAVYANNVANAITTYGGTISGSLATATQANPYVSTLTLPTPTFNVSADEDVRLQIAVVAQATSVYAFYGLVVKYQQTSF